MDNKKIKEIADYVYTAQKELKEITKLTEDKYPTLSVSQSYEVQKELIELYKQDGFNVLAPKMGLTSKAKWDQMNVDSPIVGYIFEEMVEKDDVIKMSDYIHPKVEPEIGIVLKNDIKGDDLTIEDVLKNIDYVFSCVEVIDSRYKDFNFDLPSVIADNTSASGAFLSKEKFTVDQIDLVTEEVTLSINGVVETEGNGSNVLGHPAESIVWLAKHLAKDNLAVPANVPIMTGGLTAAALVKTGDTIEVEYSNLAKITIKVEK